MGHTPRCLPCASAAPSRAYVDHPAPYRQSLSEMLHQSPALFPHDMDQGFPLHDADASVKQDVLVRRITLHTTGAVFSLRPSCVLPSMRGRTAAVDKARSLRQWGGPCDALASVVGREALGWERAGLACGRPSLVGPTIQEPQTLPRDLVADAQLTRVATPQVSVATPGGGGCCPGGKRGRGGRDGDRGAGRWGVCQGCPGPGARRSGALGVHRRLGSHASGGAGPLSHEHAGAVRSAREPEEGKSPVRANGATRDSTRPGRSRRRRPHGRSRSACGAWPRGPRRPAGDRWPRGWCRGVAVGRSGELVVADFLELLALRVDGDAVALQVDVDALRAVGRALARRLAARAERAAALDARVGEAGLPAAQPQERAPAAATASAPMVIGFTPLRTEVERRVVAEERARRGTLRDRSAVMLPGLGDGRAVHHDLLRRRNARDALDERADRPCARFSSICACWSNL